MADINYSDIKILVADDVNLNILLVRKALSLRPYTILTASNGEQALEMIRQNQPHLLLLDLMMPGIDGFEVIKQVRSGQCGKADVPIIILSALSSEDDLKKGIEIGANDYVTKPIMIPRLLEVVNAHIDAIVQK